MSRADRMATQTVEHVVTLETITSTSWVNEDNTPATVLRWRCSCGRIGSEFWPTKRKSALACAGVHVTAATGGRTAPIGAVPYEHRISVKETRRAKRRSLPFTWMCTCGRGGTCYSKTRSTSERAGALHVLAASRSETIKRAAANTAPAVEEHW